MHWAFRPEASVEGLDEGIVQGFPWPGKVDLHTVEVGPLVEHLAGGLRAIVDPKALGLAVLTGQTIECETIAFLSGQSPGRV